MEDAPRHQCLIYAGAPSQYLEDLAAVIIGKLKAKNRCLYLNAPPMVAGIRSYLAAAGLDVGGAVARGALVLSSEQTHLAGGRFVPERLLQLLEEGVKRALCDGYSGLWATGDMAWEFGSNREFSKLLEYEWGLEDLFKKYSALSGVCQYHIDTLPEQAVRDGWYAHRGVYLNHTLSRLNPSYTGQRCRPQGPELSLEALKSELTERGEPIDS